MQRPENVHKIIGLAYTLTYEMGNYICARKSEFNKNNMLSMRTFSK